MEIVIITEEKAGHLSQSKGIASLIDREKNVRVISVSLKKGTLESLIRTSVALSHKTGKPSTEYLFGVLSKYILPDDLNHLESNHPDLIISAGTIPASFNAVFAEKFGCPNVVAMRPSIIPLNTFSLVILPKHDTRETCPENVLSVSTSPNECLPELIKSEGARFASENNLDNSGGYWSLFIGGESKARHFPERQVLDVAKNVFEIARNHNRKCLVTTSRRTPSSFENGFIKLTNEYKNTIAYLQLYSSNPKSTTKSILALSSHVLITEDSVSMVSESLWAKRNTFLIELPSKSPSKKDKIDRFKKNLIEKNMIQAIGVKSSDPAHTRVAEFKPDWNSFDDIDMIKNSVNRILKL